MTEIKLPHNLAAEQSILGSILVDAGACAEVFQILTSADFYSPRHGRIFEVCAQLFDEGAGVDLVTVQPLAAAKDNGITVEFCEGLLSGFGAISNVKSHANQVRESACRREIVRACNEALSESGNVERSAEEVVDELSAAVSGISVERGGSVVSVGSVVDDFFEKIDSKEELAPAISTGFRDVDAKIGGGFHPGELIIVAGRPSMGKTSWALNSAINVGARNHGVLIFSLEMTKESLCSNMIASTARVPIAGIRGRSLTKEQWRSINVRGKQLRKFPIQISDTPAATVGRIAAITRSHAQRSPVDLVVVDYLQLLDEPGADRSNRVQQITMITRGLKKLALSQGVTVLALSQLSRAVENRDGSRPRLSDLRDSGSIEQDADVVLMLYRQEYYQPERPDIAGKAELIVAKQRTGTTGAVPLCWNGSQLRFADQYEFEEVVGA